MKYFIFVLMVATGLGASIPALAAEVNLVPSSLNLQVGDEFHVDIVVNTDESLNAVAGHLIYPVNLLQVKEIRNGDSVVNFWVTPPNNSQDGLIDFSGITPGGFLGPKEQLLSVVFVPVEKGTASVSLDSLQFLKNDGRGTAAQASSAPISLSIAAGDSAAQKDMLVDTEPPEDFTPLIAQAPDAWGSKQMVVFSTQDKISGVDKYFVREYKIAPLKFLSQWRETSNQYELRDQKMQSYIEIKALDFSGNQRTEVLLPTNPLIWYQIIWQPVILLVVVITIGKLWRRLRKK